MYRLRHHLTGVMILFLAAVITGAAIGEDIPYILTDDIQQGIETHIEEQVAAGNGFFRVPFEGQELALKLVRVHTEYLATLGPTLHFACVDMVGEDGEFYDLDFFMEGPPGSMKVTETTVHKINGRPLYVWEQAPDKTWHRAPVDGASNELLGALSGTDRFTFWYQAIIPPLSNEARVWIPLAQSDRFQKVEVLSITGGDGYRTLVDPEYGNTVMYLELGPSDVERRIRIAYDVERLEKSAYESAEDPARHLNPEGKAPANGAIAETALKVVAGKEGELERARALYDHVVDEMAYKRCGSGWGQGDAVRACRELSGNCSDYHAYFVALCRAAGIPARFAIGAAIPSDRDEGGVDGYHCWAEFFAEGKWWPVDISEADKFTALSMYYFGHHPANRFEFSRGRDIKVTPGPRSGPINFLAYPVVEIDGNQRKVKTLFGFSRL